MKIAIIGKLGNTWGLEGIIDKNLDKVRMGIFGISTFNKMNYLDWPFDEYDALVFIQGRSINRKILKECKAKKILWNAEFWAYDGFLDSEEAISRLDMVEPLEDFDLILNGCPKSTNYLKETRGLNIEWFPMMGVDRELHKKNCFLDKDTDIGFYGVASPRRLKIWKRLIEIAEKRATRPLRLAWKQVYGQELMNFINSCKMVLNIHFTDQLNTESRIYEVLGCGVLCLTEPITCPSVFVDKIHLYESGADDFGEMAIGLVNIVRDEHRGVAQAGYKYVHNRFSIKKVLGELEERVSRL